MHQPYRIDRDATGQIIVRDSATGFVCLFLSPAEAQDLAQRLQTLAMAPPQAPAPFPPLADTLSPLPTTDVGALLQQAVQRLRTETAPRTATPDQASGHRHGHGQRHSTSGDQDTGWCSLHNLAMKRHVNTRGTWFSHRLSNGDYCKGAK